MSTLENNQSPVPSKRKGEKMLAVWLKMGEELKATAPKPVPSPRLRGNGARPMQETKASQFFIFPSPSCDSVTPSKEVERRSTEAPQVARTSSAPASPRAGDVVVDSAVDKIHSPRPRPHSSNANPPSVVPSTMVQSPRAAETGVAPAIAAISQVWSPMHTLAQRISPETSAKNKIAATLLETKEEDNEAHGHHDETDSVMMSSTGGAARRPSFDDDDDTDSLIEATSLHRRLEHMCMFNTIKTPLGFVPDCASVMTTGTVAGHTHGGHCGASVAGTPMSVCGGDGGKLAAHGQYGGHGHGAHAHAGKPVQQVVMCCSCGGHGAMAIPAASTPALPPAAPAKPAPQPDRKCASTTSTLSSGGGTIVASSVSASSHKVVTSSRTAKAVPGASIGGAGTGGTSPIKRPTSSSHKSPRGASCEITSRRNKAKNAVPPPPVPGKPSADSSGKRTARSVSLGAALRHRHVDSDDDEIDENPGDDSCSFQEGSVKEGGERRKQRRGAETATSTATSSRRPPLPAKSSSKVTVDTKKRSSSKTGRKKRVSVSPGPAGKPPLWVSPIASSAALERTASGPLSPSTKTSHRASPSIPAIVSPRGAAAASKATIASPSGRTQKPAPTLRVNTAAATSKRGSPMPSTIASPSKHSVPSSPRSSAQQFEKCSKQLTDLQALLAANKGNAAMLKEIAQFAERLAALSADGGSA